MRHRFFFLVLLLYAGTLFAEISSEELFKQADKLFIKNRNIEAIKLYKKIVARNDNDRLVMLSLYKIGYNYELRLFNYREALKWYIQLVRRYPRSRQANIAVLRIKKIEKIIYKGEVSRHEKFEKTRWDYYVTRYKNVSQNKKKKILKKRINELYKFTENSLNSPFAKQYIQETFDILLRENRLKDADNLISVGIKRFPELAKANKYKIVLLKKFLWRKRIYVISWLIVIAVITLSVLMKQFKTTVNTIVENLKLIWWLPLSGLIVVLVIYILFYGSIAAAGFREDNFIVFIITFAVSLFLAILYNGLFVGKNIKKSILFLIRLSTLIVIAASWFIYVYLFNYLDILGL